MYEKQQDASQVNKRTVQDFPQISGKAEEEKKKKRRRGSRRRVFTWLCMCWASLAVTYVGVSKSSMALPFSFSYFSLYFTCRKAPQIKQHVSNRGFTFLSSQFLTPLSYFNARPPLTDRLHYISEMECAALQHWKVVGTWVVADMVTFWTLNTFAKGETTTIPKVQLYNIFLCSLKNTNSINRSIYTQKISLNPVFICYQINSTPACQSARRRDVR